MAETITVTAHLDTPSIGLDTHPLMLDGPLAWAYAMHTKAHGGKLPAITAANAPDLPLPLATHHVGEVWVWATSRAALDAVAYTSVQVRRKPATGPMARFAPDRKHHAGLGPFKARDATLSATWITRADWVIECTDQPLLEALLTHITHLGARHRNGFGHVHRWTIDSGADRAWTDRPMPHPDGAPCGIRAPYWHHTRRHPCR